MPLELFVSYIFLVINKNVVTSGNHNISKKWSHSILLSEVQVGVFSPYLTNRTAFTVATTLIGTSAAWASYFARTKHNQRLSLLLFLFISREKDIKEINQSIADIPKKTNKMYDRMDMIILGSSALVVGYVFCFVT